MSAPIGIAIGERKLGVAGEFSYTANVVYPDGESATALFVSNIYDGPIVLVLPSGIQSIVDKSVLDKIGRVLSKQWITRFYTYD